MAFEEPAKPRFRIEEDAQRLTINIPSKKQWFIIIFLSMWLCGWAVGELFVGAVLFGGLLTTQAPEEGVDVTFSVPVFVFLLVWLIAWTGAGLFAIYAWLWNVAGWQVVTLDVDGLRIENVVPLWRRRKEYRLDDVKALRVSPEGPIMWTFRDGARFWGIGDGALAFDYGAKTVRFGAGIDEAEAKIIFAAIAARHPKTCQPDEPPR